MKDTRLLSIFTYWMSFKCVNMNTSGGGVCHQKISTIGALYFNSEMRDNCYLCSDCRKKCSPFLDDLLIHSWTSEDALNHMAFLEEANARIETDFEESDSVSNRDGKLISVDEKRRWWFVPGTSDIFRLEQIESWQLHISTNTDEDSGLHLRKFKAPRGDMPVPGRLEELDGMKLVIQLKDHPYAEEVTIKITDSCPLFKLYSSYIKESYDVALKLYEFLEKYSDKNVVGDIQF